MKSAEDWVALWVTSLRDKADIIREIQREAFDEGAIAAIEDFLT